MEVATGSNVQPLAGSMGRDDKVCTRGKSIPLELSAFGVWSRTPRTNSPADAVLLHLPVLAILAVKDLVGVVDVFL